ncbi:hypothetical protein L195_g061006, partial [Trifolium pratense]
GGGEVLMWWCDGGVVLTWCLDLACVEVRFWWKGRRRPFAAAECGGVLVLRQ